MIDNIMLARTSNALVRIHQFNILLSKIYNHGLDLRSYPGKRLFAATSQTSIF